MRSVFLCLALAGCARPIGVLSVNQLLEAGRPREAWVALQQELDPEDPNPRLLAMHQAALLHAGGDFAGSEAAFLRAEAAPGYEALPVEAEVVARLRATNQLALKQDPTAFIAALPQVALDTPTPARGVLVVVFERGLAPRARISYPEGSKARQVTIIRDTREVPAHLQLDDGPMSPAKQIDNVAPRWEDQLRARIEQNTSLGQKLGLDPFAAMREVLSQPATWWTAPIEWYVDQRALPAGRHVVTVTTAAGRRSRVVEVPAGKQVFVVVPQ